MIKAQIKSNDWIKVLPSLPNNFPNKHIMVGKRFKVKRVSNFSPRIFYIMVNNRIYCIHLAWIEKYLPVNTQLVFDFMR